MSKLTKTMGTSGIVLSMLTVAASSWACGDGTISIVSLPTLGGSSFQANAINSSGRLTGVSYLTGDTGAHAFLYDGILHDLGTLGGTVSQGFAISPSGNVAGESNTTGDNSVHAFLHTGGVMLDLGTLGGSWSTATGVNNAGQVSGTSPIAGDAASHAFLYSGGSLFDLGTLGGNNSSAYAINGSGVIAGDSETASFETHAFTYSSGVMTDLGTLGGDYSSPMAINDAGQVVGEAYTANFDTHAFLYSGNTMMDLGTLGGNNSTAIAINNAGQVLGNSETIDGQSHGFLYNNGSLTDLGTLGGTYSTAMSFNNLGQVVGFSANAAGEDRPFLWQNGTMVDLNSILPVDSGWELTMVFQISDTGRIVGYGFYQGNFQWYALNLSSPNTPPVAVTGPDQSVNCQTSVTLDGSASSDPEGDALSFQWLENGTVLGTNAMISVEFEGGSHVITLVVTDACGTSAETNMTVHVAGDSSIPIIASVPAAATVSAGANGLGVVPDFTGGVVVSDNCTPAAQLAITQSPAAGTQVGLGQYSVTITVNDAAGNSCSSSATLTVVDTTAPIVTGGAGTITESIGWDGFARIPNVKAGIVATDNCTPANQLVITQSPAAGTYVGLGNHTVTVTVKDAAGNVTTKNASFKVVDTTAPIVLLTFADPEFLCGPSGAKIPVTVFPLALDNVDLLCVRSKIISVSCNESTAAGDIQITGDLTVKLANSRNTSARRVYTVKVSCTDSSGNSSTGSVKVVVP